MRRGCCKVGLPDKMASLAGDLLLRLRRYRNHRRIIARREDTTLQIRSRTIEFEGLRYHLYQTRNGRRPLVLLHGFLDTAQTFRRHFQALAGDHEIYALDVPGFGYSPLPYIRPLWDISAIARGIARLLEQKLQLERFEILGHSMGGVIATHIAGHHRRTGKSMPVERLHLAAPGLLSMPKEERDKRRKLLFPQNMDDLRRLMGQLYNEQTPDLPHFILLGLLRQWQNPGYVYMAENIVERESEFFFTTDQLRDLNVPMALYWGREDNVTPVEIALAVKESVPESDLHIIENARHALHLEKPEEFLEAFRLTSARRLRPGGGLPPR